MKKLTLWILCIALLSGIASMAMAEDYLPAFEGYWVDVADTPMEVCLPEAWTHDTTEEVPSGLKAKCADPEMRLTLTIKKSTEKTADELFEDYTKDDAYRDVERADLNGIPYVLMEAVDSGAYVGVTAVGDSGVFMFTFRGAETPENRMLVRGIMDSLRLKEATEETE